MMRFRFSFLTLSIGLLLSIRTIAQNPIAQLKFEDAENAFNKQDYAKALGYIDETEALVGTTSKTLYLRIVTQDKLIESDLPKHFDLIKTLKTNSNKYLEALKNNEIDDKYRTVYRISEKIKDYPATKTDLDQWTSTTKNGSLANTFSGNSEVANILKAYLKAVSGGADLGNLKTLTTETEVYQDGKLANTISDKKAIGKYYSEVKTTANTSTIVVYNQGKGYTKSFGMQLAMTAGTLAIYKKMTASQIDLLSLATAQQDFSSATLENGVFNGVQVDIIKNAGNEFYFDSGSHLLIAQKTYLTPNHYQQTVYQDYKSVNQFLFPFTMVVTSDPLNNNKASEKLLSSIQQQSKGMVAVGLLGPRKKKKANATNSIGNLASELVESMKLPQETVYQVKSIKINETIQNSYFEVL